MKIVQSQNILNWYPFNKTDKILIIGKQSKELIDMLNKKVSDVTIIEKIIDKNLDNTKYDFIIMVGILENWNTITENRINFETLLNRISQNLNLHGKLLIAIDNKFGLRFFAGNPEKILKRKFESLIGYNNNPEKIESFTKQKIKKILNKLGYNTRFYYPLPDYKIPNVIFTDEQLPEYNSIDKYNPYFEENSDILFNEIDVFREILKTDKNMFTFFTNSFLIEATKEECNKEYKYISFNNIRKEEYRLITKISDDCVEKQKISDKSIKHYNEIISNIEILKNNKINTLDYVEEGKIKSKYIEQKYLLNNVLVEMLEQKKYDKFYNVIDNYIKIISTNSYKESNPENTVFNKYNIKIKNKEEISNLNFVSKGLWDMTFKNCFFIDNDFWFFDQEWEEDNIPVEYILYRSIYYTISLRRFIKIDNLLERYNLIQYLDLFTKLDNKIQEEIRDNEIWKFYSENHDFDIDATKQELLNISIRDNAKEGRIKQLEEENAKLKIENQNLNKQIDKNIFKRVKKKLQSIKKLK